MALDHVGWDCIDAVRAANGWAPVGRMGRMSEPPAARGRHRRRPASAAACSAAPTLYAAAQNMQAGRATEEFNLRQPEHVVLAGELGLGVFPRERIEHRCVVLPA